MKAKEYLQQLKRLDTLINQKIQELGELRAMSTVGSVDYSKERVQSSPSQDAPFVRVIHKIIELEEEINAEIDKFIDKKHLIINQIQELHNADEINVLYDRYVEFKTFEKIAVDLNYTIRNIYFIHGRALQNFETTILQRNDSEKQ